MARFTVQDCMEKISNRFDMTLVASTRARQLEKEEQYSYILNINNDKSLVLSLREIADGYIDQQILQNLN
jgi:DNA-directed RNA polymerase subunit omega